MPVLVAQERPMQLDDTKVPKGRPAPRMANGKPDFSGYWKGTTQTRPGGNIGKDLPGWKLPLTPAGEAALKHNLTATVDPEAVCIIGGIPRHNASGLPFEVLPGQQQDHVHVLVQLLPPGAVHARAEAFGRSRSVVLRRGDRPVGGRHARHRLDRVQGREGVDRRERQPAQRRAARRRALDAARLQPHPRRDADRGSRSSTPSRSPTRARGHSASRTSRSRSTPAARTT